MSIINLVIDLAANKLSIDFNYYNYVSKHIVIKDGKILFLNMKEKHHFVSQD